MRYPVLVLCILLTGGCASTRTVEVARADTEVFATINARAKGRRAKVELGGPARRLDLAESLTVADDSVRYTSVVTDSLQTIPLAEVFQITVGPRAPRHNTWKRAVVMGLSSGLLAGGVAMVGHDCSGDWCGLESLERFSVPFLLGFLPGALIGAIIGRGTPETIYRFRPDSQQQMTVLNGVGPGEK